MPANTRPVATEGRPSGAQPALAEMPAGQTCADCGTPIPQRETRCAICARRARAEPSDAAGTAMNWLIMSALMAVIFAVGIHLAP